jgi:hypothetical protein
MFQKTTKSFLIFPASIAFLVFLGANVCMALEEAELKRINAFLELLSAKTELVFERNGSEYPVDRAVAHLKSKLSRAKARLSTAEEFVDNVASKSSLSGQPYFIIFPDGKRVEAGLYFHELLADVSAEGDAQQLKFLKQQFFIP